MKKIIFLVVLILVSVSTIQAQGPIRYKVLTEGDSLFSDNLGTSGGIYKICQVTLHNPSATLTDSLKLYRISTKFGTTAPSDTTEIGLKKFSYAPPNRIQNDTIYTLIILEPGEEKEMLVWFPHPDWLLWVLVNAGYEATRECRIKNRYLNN